jgi:hypothetical protein
MRRLTLVILLILTAMGSVFAQRTSPPTEAELAAITARGRLLAEYDVAAWHGTDAVIAMKPPEGSFTRYLAKKNGDRWVVAFGRLNEKHDRFLIVYEATQGATPQEFSGKEFDPPKEDAGFFLGAAKAIDIVLADFKGAARPYNVAVLPAAANELYVYVVPAQTKDGVYPLGGDARYTVSADGAKIIQKRQMHIAILEVALDATTQMAFHAAVIDDIPEDSDVFHVLTRQPRVPELIATRQYVFQIEPDGRVRYLMTMEAFRKIK